MDVTLAFIIAWVTILFGVDLWLIIRKGYSHTISARLLTLSKGYPVVPLLIGIALGHLFWPNEHACKLLVDEAVKEAVSKK
jgi:hypothetical protein